MTLFQHRWKGRRFDAAEAVKASVSPSDPYAVSGELELMRHQIDRLTDLCGHLVKLLHDKGALRDEDVEDLADNDYERVPD